MLRLPPRGTLSLECSVSRLMVPPKKLEWKHKDIVLTPKERPGVSLGSTKLAGVSHTKLVIVDLKRSDEGTYQCVTTTHDDNVPRPASVQLFIGETENVVKNMYFSLFYYFAWCHSTCQFVVK